MKKVLKYRLFGVTGLAGLLLLTLAGCHKDDTQTTLRVKRAGYQPQQVEKTYIGTGLLDTVVSWYSTDQVNLYGIGTPCSLSNINEGYAEINVGSASSPYYAVYPATNTVTTSGGTVSISPSQDYIVDVSGTQTINAPMAAKMTSSDGYLYFRNVASLLRIAVMNGNENGKYFDLNSISVTADNGAILTGDQQFTFLGSDTKDYGLNNTTLSNGGNTVTLNVNCAAHNNSDVRINAGNMEVFNMVVLPYSSSKLSITVTGTLQDSTQKTYTIVQNTARSLSAGEVAVQFFATSFDKYVRP